MLSFATHAPRVLEEFLEKSSISAERRRAFRLLSVPLMQRASRARAARTTQLQFPQSRAEHLYRLLDDRAVQGPDGEWRIRVYSVMPTGSEWWIQIAIVGRTTYSLLVRIGQNADAADAMRAVREWLSSDDVHDDRILDCRFGMSGLQAAASDAGHAAAR